MSNTFCPSVTKNSTPFLDLAANTLPELGNRVPEKWEGLAIGPRLSNGSYVVLAGTDNDYSVTQNGSGTQFDVYFNFTPPSRTLPTTLSPIRSSVRSARNTTASPPTVGPGQADADYRPLARRAALLQSACRRSARTSRRYFPETTESRH